MKKITLAIALILAGITYADYTCTTNGYTFHYTLSDGKATIVPGLKDYSGTLVVPSVLDGNPVSCIGQDAFSHMTNRPHIIVSEGVEKIEGAHFTQIDVGWGVKALQSLPVSVVLQAFIVFAISVV